MPRPIRNNQPQAHLRRAPTIADYAAEKLQVCLDPNLVKAPLDDESRLAIDACALVATSVAAYAPQHAIRLRAIFRDMLQEQVRVTCAL